MIQNAHRHTFTAASQLDLSPPNFLAKNFVCRLLASLVTCLHKRRCYSQTQTATPWKACGTFSREEEEEERKKEKKATAGLKCKPTAWRHMKRAASLNLCKTSHRIRWEHYGRHFRNYAHGSYFCCKDQYTDNMLRRAW